MTRQGRLFAGRMLAIIVAFCTVLWPASAAFAEADYDKVKRSVVRVMVFRGNDFSMGSGFVVSSQGHVITNAHVIEPGGRLGTRILVFPSGEDVPVSVLQSRGQQSSGGYTGIVIARDQSLDLAILQVNGLERPALKLSTSKPKTGDTVVAIGYPFMSDVAGFRQDSINGDPTQTRGEITKGLFLKALKQRGDEVQLVQHSAQIQRGNSGGPLINACGDVIGVNTLNLPDGSDSLYFSTSSIGLSAYLTGRVDSSLIKQTRTTCYNTGEDPRFWILIGSVIVGVVALLLLVVLLSRRGQSGGGRRRRSRDEEPGYTAPPPLPAEGAGGGLLLTGFHPKSGRKIVVEVSGDMLRRGGFIVGREHVAAEREKDDRVSRRHALIQESGGRYTIEDLSSVNGTWVNDVKIRARTPTPFVLGDKIKLALIELSVGRL